MRTHTVVGEALHKGPAHPRKTAPFMSLAAAPPPDIDRTDEDLLALIAEGNEAAFSVFYDRTASRVLGIVTRVLIDHSQSEEVTQEVFLQAWQTASRFDPARGKALGWLLTMAHRRAVDRVRSSQADRNRGLSIGIRDFHDAQDDIADTAETVLEHQRVKHAMKGLTPLQQQALELAYFDGLTHSEVALTVGVPLGTMKTRIRGALIALRELIGESTAA